MIKILIEWITIVKFVIFIKPKYKHFKSNIHKEFDKKNHKNITNENLDTNNIDKSFYAYIIQHNRKRILPH